MSSSGKPELFTTEQQQLGVVYAKALLSVGEKSGDTEQLLDELDAIADAVSQSPKLDAAFHSPQVSVEEKQKLVNSIFGGKASAPMLNFLQVLVSKGRFDCLRAVSAAARTLSDERSGQIQATLTTAEAVDDNIRNKIADALSKKLGKKVKLEAFVDPSIVGGIVVRVGDTVYDSSVVGQLQQVRRRAVEKATEAIREKLDRFASGA